MFAQTAYFIDGYHGGIWGHYPVRYTSYIIEQMSIHPDWKVNLEIEPETWDRVEKRDKLAYDQLKKYLSDQSSNARVEYVNPAYGQPYMFNVSGESIIRHFHYGIKKLRQHFPDLTFSTYSSEEPCFTSSLPQILKSFGYQYASLKNPNTCWGGYTRAFGGELVNWIGPDGTAIVTSPRYEVESLKPKSTWETIGNANSDQFINSAFEYGIRHPIGMCLQDAEWRVGPWLKGGVYQPTVYTTWRNYFENVASAESIVDWKLSQEDVLVSLVWGSQVLQKLAQEVRYTENKLIKSEKIAAMHRLENGGHYPEQDFESAWHTLMLAQHHDCWIVPYNGEEGNTWADKVKVWTASSNRVSDSIVSINTSASTGSRGNYFKVLNTTGKERTEWATVDLGNLDIGKNFVVVDHSGRVIPSQVLDENKMIFLATVPAFGYATFQLKKGSSKLNVQDIAAVQSSDGNYVIETDHYKIVFDVDNGGTINSLVAKKLNNKEFIDPDSDRKFNELRGNFLRKGGFRSSTEIPAELSIGENGPYLVRIKIDGEIAGNPFHQWVTLRQTDRLIDVKLEIDWRSNEKIGEFEETDYQATNLRKAFYNDRYKLLTLFPVALNNQKIYKNAPFDVTESELTNTFFSQWDSIKNNIVYSWVDVVDTETNYGMAVFTDHTTSYAHGENHPLGITTLYSGQGLWGRDYKVTEATVMNYSLLPHEGTWDEVGLEIENEKIAEPLVVQTLVNKPKTLVKSFAEVLSKDLIISSCSFRDDYMLMRIYNTGRDVSEGRIKLNFPVRDIDEINLDGSLVKNISTETDQQWLHMKLNPFGFKTLKINLK